MNLKRSILHIEMEVILAAVGAQRIDQ
uniref:Uncharacterized protein n=1 Tax=Arundo donax TaxID=35708 RepID=A0A0A9GWS0_ARUDO